MDYPELVQQFTEFRKKAEERSRRLIDNGREVTDVERAVDESAANTYAFVLCQMQHLVPQIYAEPPVGGCPGKTWREVAESKR